MRGPDATLAIRKLGSDVLVIGITGNVLQDDVELFLSHGANSVLAKPLSVSKLMDTLKTLKCAQIGEQIL
jgi:CheY-like chemotaxis protein